MEEMTGNGNDEWQEQALAVAMIVSGDLLLLRPLGENG